MNSRRATAAILGAAAIREGVDEAATDFSVRSAEPADPADPARVVSAWPRPVSLLAAGVGDWLHAVTATTVGCIDVTPTLVMAVVPASSRIRWLVDLAGGFAVTLLGHGQSDLAERFAARERPLGPAQFEELRWHVENIGAPVLDDAGPWLDCRLESVLPAGAGSSSVVLIGRAVAAELSVRPGALLRHRGAYLSLPPPGPVRPAPERPHDLCDPSINLSVTEQERG